MDDLTYQLVGSCDTVAPSTFTCNDRIVGFEFPFDILTYQAEKAQTWWS